MKKIIAILAALAVLLMSAALADDLTALTDEELLALWNDVQTEMTIRGMSLDGSDKPKDLNTIEMLERMKLFFHYWSMNELDSMVELCSTDWKETVENQKTALFAILANRTPKTLQTVNISGQPQDTIRRVSVKSWIDRNNGKGPSQYYLEILMVLEGDGQWYVDPRCLKSHEPIEAPDPEPTETPEPASGDTVLFYVPAGGSYYHVDQNCRRVSERYLPMEGMFLFSEVNDESYRHLAPCAVCGAPLRTE